MKHQNLLKSNFSDKTSDYKDIHGFATMITIWWKIKLLEIRLFFSWKLFGYLVKSKQTLQIDEFFTLPTVSSTFLSFKSSEASTLFSSDFSGFSALVSLSLSFFSVSFGSSFSVFFSTFGSSISAFFSLLSVSSVLTGSSLGLSLDCSGLGFLASIRKVQFWLKYYQKIPLDGV